MITPGEIAKKTMTPAKRATAYNDFFAFYVGRPISYILTIPFLYTGISPNTISLISMIPVVIGFILFCVARTKSVLIIGWLMFFLWNLLDGVDGNVARYKKQFSKLGSVYDAMSGYLAMLLSFFAVGVGAAHFGGVLDGLNINKEMYIILGSLAGAFMIFPRLVMHKAISTLMDVDAVNDVKDKSSFSTAKVIALNLESVAGGAQVFMLLSVIANIMDLYTVCYFFLNTLIMIVSLHSILKENKS